MTPKEKARELVDYFLNLKPVKLDEQLVIEHPTALRCAKKLANDAYKQASRNSFGEREDVRELVSLSFWFDVIDELDKM